MAIKQEDLLGMLVPSVDITRITIETSRPSGLSVTVALSVYDVIEKDKISRWFAQEDFARFIKVALFQASSKSGTALAAMAISNLNTSSAPPNFGDATAPGVEIKTYSMNEVLPAEENYFENSVRTVQSDGTSFHEFKISQQFTLEEEPSELNYTALSYIDIQEMEDFFNVELMSMLQQEESARQNGKVSYEEVIKNGETVSTSIVYLTKEGEVWNGPKHVRNGQWFAGTRKAGSDLIENGSFPEPLTTKRVPNAKIQDFRILERAKRLEIDETLFHNALSEVAIADQSNIETLRQTFYSDVWLTRGLPGEARFMFAIDMATMIRKLGHYGKILDKMDSASQQRLLSYSKIRTMKLLRKRVRNVETLNSLGTPYGGKVDFERNQEIEVIAFTGQIDDKLVEVSDEKGSIRESGISLDTNNTGVRFFTGTDKSIIDITDGLYQYGIEIDFIDGTRQFLQDIIDELSISRNDLSSILARVEAPTMKQDYLYNPNLNRFEEDFAFTPIERQNISRSLILYNRVLSIFGKTTFIPLLRLIAETPSFIRFMVEVFDLLIAKLSTTIEVSTDQNSKSKIGSGLKFIITDKKFFANATFDSNIEKGNGLDFLTNPEDAGQIDGEILEISEEQKNTTGLKIVDAGEWEKRLNLELEKFFTSKTPEATFPKKNSKSLEPDSPVDFSGPSSAFMTPTIIKKSRITIPSVLDDNDQQKKKEDRMVQFKDNSGNALDNNIFSSFGISFNPPSNSTLESDTNDIQIENVASCFGIDENRETGIDPVEGWEEVDGRIISLGLNESLEEEYTTSTGACEEGDSLDKSAPASRLYDLMRETIVNVGIQKSSPGGLLSEPDLRRVYSSIDNLKPPTRENLKFAPLQIQSLFPEFESQSLSRGFELTGPKFRVNYSFLAKIDYLKDFGDNEVVFDNERERKNYKQIKEPVWESLDKRVFLTVAGEEILCRLKLTTIEELGIKVSDPFKSLPVYDAYFILKPPVTRINAALLQEPEELEVQGIQETEVLVGSVDSEFQQIFENQISFLRHFKMTLEQEDRELESERTSLLLLINEIRRDPNSYLQRTDLRSIRGDLPLRPDVEARINLIEGRISTIERRRREIRDELAESKFDLLSL
jgi:hypothetical protein